MGDLVHTDILAIVRVFKSFEEMFPGKIDGVPGHIPNKKPHERVGAEELIGVNVENVKVGKQVFIQPEADLDGRGADENGHFFKPAAVVDDEGFQRHKFLQSIDEFLLICPV